jgi:hypothetical protein
LWTCYFSSWTAFSLGVPPFQYCGDFQQAINSGDLDGNPPLEQNYHLESLTITPALKIGQKLVTPPPKEISDVVWSLLNFTSLSSIECLPDVLAPMDHATEFKFI